MAKIKTHVLEKIIGGLMVVFALAAIYVFWTSLTTGLMVQEIAILELLLILILAVLAQTVVLLRIYDQHI